MKFIGPDVTTKPVFAMLSKFTLFQGNWCADGR